VVSYNKCKKVASIILSLSLIFTLLLVPTASAENVVYHESFLNGTGAAVQSGGAKLTHVTGKIFDNNEDGAALYISNRVNNWDAADFRFADIGLKNGKTYLITVNGYVDPDTDVPNGAQVWLQTVNSFGWWGGVDMKAGEAFTLKGTYTVDTNADTSLRIQSNDAGASVPFYIGEIIITELDVQGDTEEKQPAVPAEDFSTVTFEDQTTGGLPAGQERRFLPLPMKQTILTEVNIR